MGMMAPNRAAMRVPYDWRAGECLREPDTCSSYLERAKTDAMLTLTITKKTLTLLVVFFTALILSGCGQPPWNDPNPPNPEGEVVYQSVMSPAPPKHLDPAVSYATDESLFISQIYEPPMGYHFLKRPYELEALALQTYPTVEFLNAQGEVIAEDDPEVVFSRYVLRLREDLHYQPHPAFALNDAGEPLYVFDNVRAAAKYHQVPDFPETGETVAFTSEEVD